MVFGGVIWRLAPVDSIAKELDSIERKVYRMRSRIVLGAEGIFFVIGFCFRWKIVMRSVTMSFLVVGISLLIGMLKRVRKTKLQNMKRGKL